MTSQRHASGHHSTPLRGSDNRWRSVAHHHADTLTVIDHDRRILYINHAPPSVAPEQLIGRSVYELVPVDSAAAALRQPGISALT